jgi:hypothetical protein
MAIPVGLVVRHGLAYGVFFNTTYRSRFDLGAARQTVWELATTGPELDYYVALGPTPPEVLAQFAELLGTMPLPPRWALGYHQSRWSYLSADEIRELAAEFRKRQIPCDVIHFDIDYMHDYRVFTWQPERFSDPAALVRDLRQDGFRVVTIIDPGVKADPEYAVYQSGLEHDFFIHRAEGDVFPRLRLARRFRVRGFFAAGGARLVGRFAAVAGRAWRERRLERHERAHRFARPFSSGYSAPGTLPADAGARASAGAHHARRATQPVRLADGAGVLRGAGAATCAARGRLC